MVDINRNGEKFCRAVVMAEGIQVPPDQVQDIVWSVTGSPGEEPTIGLDTSWGGNPLFVRMWPKRPGPFVLSFECAGSNGPIGFSDSGNVVAVLVPDSASPEYTDLPPNLEIV